MVENRVKLDEETRKCLESRELIPCPVEIRGRKYYPEDPSGSGFKGVVWKGKDEWGNSVAIKFAVSEDYENRSFLQEISLANKLRGYPRFAQFVDAGIIEIKLPSAPRKFVCFIEEWIDGPTLKDHIQNASSITCGFLVEYIRMMCEALNNLNFNKLCHDDLHPGNIKIAPPKPGSLTTYEAEVKIIDTGSLKHAPTKKEVDDHLWFVRHIVDIRNAIYKRKRFSVAERRFLQEVVQLMNRMLDEDKTVALTEPSKISEQFESTWEECRHLKEEREQKLDDPFHYISAETISSDKLLVDLFAESCPWKNDVLSPDPLVLTGPRGCGKSTIFRRLSFKGMLCKGLEEIRNSNIVGFYISCSTDLRNHLNWISSENLARRFRGEIKHYFNLLLTKEIVSTFNIIAARDDRESVFGFTPDEEMHLYKFIVEKLDILRSESLHLQGVAPMAHLSELADNEIEKCHEAMARGLSLHQKTRSSYLSDLADFLCKSISCLKQRKIVFFLDDFSTRQIPRAVQTTLNDVILERAKNHLFKISTDKYGWSGLDFLSAVGEKTREFREIDCGRFYLVDADVSLKRKFTIELLAKRLDLARFKGKPEEIIGHSKYTAGSLSKTIRNRTQNKERLTDVYYGLETIMDLCCGDISVLLEIYRRIFKSGKVDADSRELVPANRQHEAIVSVSREQFDAIKSYRPYGDEMYTIATQFGTLSGRILREGKRQRQKDKYIENETTRIEVDEDPTQTHIGLTSIQRGIMEELIKRAVFIELEPGRARHGFTPSLRWHLRPVLCPTFLTAPSKNVAIKWTAEEFKYFLNAPEDKCEEEFRKWKRTEPDSKISDYTNLGNKEVKRNDLRS
jgi:hypothetical protein